MEQLDGGSKIIPIKKGGAAPNAHRRNVFALHLKKPKKDKICMNQNKRRGRPRLPAAIARN